MITFCIGPCNLSYLIGAKKERVLPFQPEKRRLFESFWLSYYIKPAQTQAS